jgi:hypothetical protein
MYRVRLLRLLRLRVGTVAHCKCFAEVVFVSLPSGVSLGNRIGDEGGKVVGDALKDNTTLSVLSLSLQGE